MIIGLDIDNVISSFDEGMLNAFLKDDINKRNKGIINKKADHVNHVLDWTNEEIDEFYANNMEKIAKTLKLRKNAKKYIDKLLDNGNEIILISHRAYPHYENALETTLNWLKNKKVNYTKLVLSKSSDKSKGITSD